MPSDKLPKASESQEARDIPESVSRKSPVNVQSSLCESDTCVAGAVVDPPTVTSSSSVSASSPLSASESAASHAPGPSETTPSTSQQKDSTKVDDREYKEVEEAINKLTDDEMYALNPLKMSDNEFLACVRRVGREDLLDLMSLRICYDDGEDILLTDGGDPADYPLIIYGPADTDDSGE